MAWLALGDARKARLAVKPLLEGASALREPACLLAAQSYELERQPVPAMALYERLLREPRPDPVVLARAAALQQRMGRADRAAQLAQRLLELYPRSAEAASARRAEAVAAATSDVRGGVAVQIGAFADAAKARELAERARRAGYPHAQVIVLGRADGQSHVVRLGVYATRAEATAAGVRAERALGTDYWLVTLQ
jgi:DedD protein